MNAYASEATIDRSTADLVVDFVAYNDASGERHDDTERSEHDKQAGGIHDDSVAQKYGYQGALVPGILICGQTMPALVEIWGRDWLRRGRIAMKHIRPAFDREELTACFKLSETDTGKHAEIVVMRGVTPVAIGDAELPNVVPAIPADFPRAPLDFPAQLPLAEPGILTPGQMLFTQPAVMDAAEHDLCLRRIGGNSRDWPYGAIHPYVYQHLTSHDAISSFTYSTPGIHVAGDTQLLDWQEPGEMLMSTGRVAAVYERKGHQYFDTEQLVQTTAGRAIALCRRTVIYKAREVAEQK
jgi:hypothetical protein